MASLMKCDMTRGNPVKLILLFSVPMIIGNIFQQFYNMVDSMVVGRYVGANALAAVGSTGSITFLFFSLVFGLAAGIGIIVSQYHGAKDEEKVRQTIATASYVIVVSSFIMGTITIIVARPIMEFLNTPVEVIDDAVLYLQVVAAGLIAVGVYNGVASILRALGDSATPLIFLIIGCGINIGLDLVFVIEFKLGVFGVALATVIAQTIAAIGCLISAICMMPILRIPLKEIRVNREIFKKCLSIGIPVALQNAMIALSCIVLQAVVNSYGATIVAAFTVASRFEQLIQQPFNSVGAAIGTYTGQNVGAGDIKRVRKGFWAGTVICVIFSIVMLPIAIFGGESIMRLFVNEEAVIVEGARGIRITCFFYSALGMIYVTRNVLNGAGDVNFAMLSGLVEVIGRVGFAKPLTLVPGIGMLSIWFTTGLTWLLTAVISCIRYKQGKWATKGIIDKKKTLQEVEEVPQEVMN